MLTIKAKLQIINEIADRLAMKEWNEIDVTLEVAGFRTQSGWSGSHRSYVMHMIKLGPDERLRDLADALGIDHVVSAPIEHAEFWEHGLFRCFISHISKHRAQASGLRDSLRHFGLTGFVAHEDILPNEEWVLTIELGLSTADCLIALIHSGFRESDWTSQEIGWALGRGIPVMTVRNGEDPSGFVGRFQAFNAHGKEHHDLAREVFDYLARDKRTADRILELVVSGIEQSTSFTVTRDWLRRAERLPGGTAAAADRIEASLDANSQVSEYVKGRDWVQEIASRWRSGGGE